MHLEINKTNIELSYKIKVIEQVIKHLLLLFNNNHNVNSFNSDLILIDDNGTIRKKIKQERGRPRAPEGAPTQKPKQKQIHPLSPSFSPTRLTALR